MKKISFKVKHAALSVAISIAVLVGLVLVNLLAGELDLKFDMTRRDLYTLTEETRQMLAEIEQEVTLYYLAKPGQENITVGELLEQYASSKSIRLEQVDPDRNPGLIARYTETSGEGEDRKTISTGSVIAVSGDRSRVIPYMDLYNVSYDNQGSVNVYGFKAEQSLSAAIQYVATGQEVVIYQLLGHNEYTFEDFGYTEPLEKSNFKLKTLNMTTAASIPEDADIVVILSPSWDYSASETDKLLAFLDRGGSMYIGLDLIQEKIPNLSALLTAWNIRLDRGIIMEQDADRLVSEFGGSPVVFSPLYAETEITGPLAENNQNMVLASSLGFSAAPIQKRNIELIPILTSTAKSWLRMDLNTASESRVMTDRPGPINAAVGAAEKNIETGFQEGAKVLAVGSASSFAPLSGMGSLKANYDFTVSALGWLAGEDKAINVQSRSLYRLPLQISAANAFIYAGLVVLVIPLGIILAGLIVYIRRKRL